MALARDAGADALGVAGPALQHDAQRVLRLPPGHQLARDVANRIADGEPSLCVGARSGRDLLAAAMAPPNFPITPEGLEGEWTFNAIDAGYHTLEDFRVRATDVEHKGGRTFGYRISDDTGSMAYIPDHVVSHGIDDAVRDLILDVDVLLHDAQFLDRERPTADNYGHSTVEDAVRLARECGVRHLVLFHHSPARKDDALDEIAGMYPSDFVTVATQGAEIDVTRP